MAAEELGSRRYVISPSSAKLSKRVYTQFEPLWDYINVRFSAPLLLVSSDIVETGSRTNV